MRVFPDPLGGESSDVLRIAMKAAYSSGTVREFHPIPFLIYGVRTYCKDLASEGKVRLA